MPVVISKIYDNGYQHGEGLVLVGLEDVEEVIILKEAHGSIGNLQVDASDTSDDSLEELWD